MRLFNSIRLAYFDDLLQQVAEDHKYEIRGRIWTPICGEEDEERHDFEMLIIASNSFNAKELKEKVLKCLPGFYDYSYVHEENNESYIRFSSHKTVEPHINENYSKEVNEILQSLSAEFDIIKIDELTDVGDIFGFEGVIKHRMP